MSLIGHTHSWRECRPAILSLSILSLDGQETSDAQVAIDMVWATLFDSERQAFHRACCFSSRAPSDMVIMKRIIEAVKARMTEVGS